jgi:hypothetical protein
VSEGFCFCFPCWGCTKSNWSLALPLSRRRRPSTRTNDSTPAPFLVARVAASAHTTHLFVLFWAQTTKQTTGTVVGTPTNDTRALTWHTGTGTRQTVLTLALLTCKRQPSKQLSEGRERATPTTCSYAGAVAVQKCQGSETLRVL